ncbi:MAG: ABC transporter substrate-binding protein [Spirochaetaceae bacterium]|jgi:ribose transport system substrate-binding protein|nr:ABC transporter substrate-binding protein [Spirochaetaceae bacterium]
MKRSVLLLLCLALVLPAAFAGGAKASDGGQDGKIYIPVVSKSFMHQWMQAVKAGVDQAAKDLGVEVAFVGPEDETMIDRQIDILKTELSKNPVAVGLAALDSQAAIPTLQEAKARNIPVIAWDSGVASDIPVTTVTTDNAAAAGIAADKMAEAIGGRGKVAIVAMDQTSLNSIARRDGFLNAMKKYPGSTVLEPQYGNGDHLRTTEIAKAVINGNPDLKGYFGANEGSAVGVINAVRELHKEGQIVVVGYDAGKIQLDAIRSGLMLGAVQQNPVKMGYLTVEWAYRVAVKKETPPKIVDSGYVWADKSNLDSPEVKAVIYD